MRKPFVHLIKDVSGRFPRFSPVVWSVHQDRRRVAITFDDGPTDVTPRVLECLAAYDAKATFFVLVHHLPRRAGILRQIIAGGHEIGMHGYNHTMRNYYGQIRRCEAELSGYGVIPSVVRTPGGAIRPGLTMRLWLRGYPTIVFNLDTHDSMRLQGKWKGPAPDYSRIRGGDIVLMHDDNQMCVQELPILLDCIKQEELQPVTVSELLGRTA